MTLSIVFVSMAAPIQAEPGFPDNCYQPCDRASFCGPCDAVGCDPCEPNSIFGSGKSVGCRRKSVFDSIEIFGWVQAGVYANSRGSTTKRERFDNYKGREVSGFEFDSGNSALLSTVHPTDFQANQVWLGAKKEADGSRGWDWGFAAEVFLGPEAWFAQSWSDAKFDYGWQDGDYFTAIPQLYFQVAYGDLSVKVGKYETVLGYEALRAPDCFFYSHSHIFMMEPYTHSGALVEYAPNDKLYLAGGYTTGGDASFENKYDDHGFLGMISYTLTPKTTISYAIHYSRYGSGRFYSNGDLRWFGKNDVYFHTVAFQYDLTKRLKYALQWNLGDAKDRDTKNHRVMYGIVNTFTYQINKRWGVGFRAEWTKDDDDVDYGGGFVGYYGGEVQGYTLGLNWTPWENISIRPEVRYDCCQDRVFNYGKNQDQFSGGVCGVFSF